MGLETLNSVHSWQMVLRQPVHLFPMGWLFAVHRSGMHRPSEGVELYCSSRGRGMVPSSLSQEAKWAEKPNHPESPIRALYIYRAEEQSHVSQFR